MHGRNSIVLIASCAASAVAATAGFVVRGGHVAIRADGGVEGG